MYHVDVDYDGKRRASFSKVTEIVMSKECCHFAYYKNHQIFISGNQVADGWVLLVRIVRDRKEVRNTGADGHVYKDPISLIAAGMVRGYELINQLLILSPSAAGESSIRRTHNESAH